MHLIVRWHEPLCNIKHVSTKIVTFYSFLNITADILIFVVIASNNNYSFNLL